MMTPESSTCENQVDEPSPRAAFTWADANDSFPVCLASVWRRLCSGEARVAENFYSARRSYIVLVAASTAAKRPPAGCIPALEFALLGNSLKTLAINQRVSVSTISSRISLGLGALGLTGRLAAAPMLCAIAVHAHRGLIQATDTRLASSGGFEVVSVARPDLGLEKWLAPAEHEVARLCLEGYSQNAIAAARSTSVRTVANQLASAFRKLKLSGRSELLCLLIRTSGRANAGLEERALSATRSGIRGIRRWDRAYTSADAC